MSTDNRNVPLFKTLEMSPFVVVVDFLSSSSSRGCAESGNPRCVRISKRSGKVRFVDFSTERLFHSLSLSGFASWFFGCSPICSYLACRVGLSFGTLIGRSGRRDHSDGRRYRDRWFAPRAHLAIVLPPGVIRLGSGRLCFLGRGLPGSSCLNWKRAGNLLPSHRPTAIANL